MIERFEQPGFPVLRTSNRESLAAEDALQYRQQVAIVFDDENRWNSVRMLGHSAYI